MRKIITLILRLFSGLFLYAAGIVLTVNANLGLAPWDAFHQGLSKMLPITMGQASIGISVIIVVINCFLREKVGWGTLANMIFIGVFIDVLMLNHMIPIFGNVFIRVLMMLLGMFVIGIATVLYIGAGLGIGPRDGLMVALTKKTNKSVRLVRTCIEVSVLTMGFILGGSIGVGTLVMASTIGYFVQLSFKVFKFNIADVKHKFIDDDIKIIRDLVWSKSKIDNVEIKE